MRLKWVVGAQPTGRYRSFERRQWPSAMFENGAPAVGLYAEESYEPRFRDGQLPFELTVRVAVREQSSWKWVQLKRRARSLDEAKALAAGFFERYPELVPLGAANG